MNKMKFTFLLFMPSILLSGTIIEGLTENKRGEPLPGANVFLKGTLEGATTDSTGKFSFKTDREGIYTLLIRYIGYKKWKKEIDLRGRTIRINAVLKREALKSGGVTVKASSFTTGDKEGVTLTPLEVLGTPGASADVCMAIKSFPGTQQVSEGAGLFVRGGEVSETKFFLDGAPVYHPYRYESPTGGFFGTFSPFLLRGTFFSSGGFSVEFGNALSGVLDMKSLDPPLKHSINLGLGLANISALARIPLENDKFGINFSANKSNTETMFEFNKTSQEFTEYPEAYDINLNAGYRYSTDGLAKIFLFREKDRVGVSLENPTWGGLYSGGGENNLGNLRIVHSINNDLQFSGSASYNYYRHDSRITVSDSSILDLDVKEKIKQVKIKFEQTFWWDLNYGLEFRQRKSRYEGKTPVEEDSLNPALPEKVFNNQYTSSTGSGWLEMKSYFPYDLTLTQGMRFDYEGERGQFTWDPRFSVSWQPVEKINILGSTGKFHQFPEPIYYDPNYGNPELIPFSARHYILSLVYKDGNDIFRLEGYWKNYERLLREDDSLNWTTEGDGYAGGIDLFAKKELGPISGRISYSYLQSEREWKDFPQSAPPKFDITHNLHAVINYSPVPFIELGMKWSYATGKPYTPQGGDFHAARVPDYYRLDLQASWLHSFYPGNMTVFYLAVNNLTAHENIMDYWNGNKNQPIKSNYGRLYYFGVSFEI